MKKILVIISIFYALTADAQNYLISFAGTGASSTINGVKVENLMAGTTLTLNGNDILHLTGATGVHSPEYKLSSELKIYPNPMTETSLMEVYPPAGGDAVITVYDMTGRQLSQQRSYLEKSGQEFRLSGFKDGLYLIRIKGNNYQISGQLLCRVNSGGTISIDKVSNNIQSPDRGKSNADKKGTGSTVDMVYTTGDRLKFTGISGIYSTVLTDIPVQDKTITFSFVACTDGSNNNYPVAAIGTQTWMASNLMTIKYGNGDLISTTSPATKDISSESSPKYQWAYSGVENNVATYGRLYTWYAVTDSRGACPAGWHLPTDAEWAALNNFLGGAAVAGNMLKETGVTHWKSPNSGATNETGFTALPGGGRVNLGIFYLIGEGGAWWSATEYNTSDAWASGLTYSDLGVGRVDLNKANAVSVRCLKD